MYKFSIKGIKTAEIIKFSEMEAGSLYAKIKLALKIPIQQEI